jgi:hypothetical protein
MSITERRIPNVRQSPRSDQVLANLGLLADLAGTWEGTGFNLIARPDRESNANLFLELNQTTETTVFEPIATSIPNRGFAVDDVELFGLTYLQKISDAVTDGALHIEPGIWITQPSPPVPLTAPIGTQFVGRMASIPHGNALLAQGLASTFEGPPTLAAGSALYNGSIFPSFNSTPFAVGAPIRAAGSAEADVEPPAPPGGFLQYTLANPAEANSRTPFGNVPPVPLPEAISGVLIQTLVNDPISLLQEVIARQANQGHSFKGVALNIATQASITFGTSPNQASPTVAVTVTDGQGGGIENTQFLDQNANSALVYATFWIETVTHPQRRESFLQLQYAQMVLLNFPALLIPGKPAFSWPHVSVGTLRKTFG